MTNVAEGHFGEWGIFDVRALAETKFTVGRIVKAGGRFVLNADDAVLVEELGAEKSNRRIAAPVVWISLDEHNPVVREHVAAGGDAVIAESGELVLVRGRNREAIERVENVPLAMGGAAKHNVANALGQAGDRDDTSIIEFARSAWRMHPDRIVLKEIEIYLPGRARGEVAAMLKTALLRLGAPAESLAHADSEMEAVKAALEWARPGDLLLLPIYAERSEVLALMERLASAGWAPGKPLA